MDSLGLTKTTPVFIKDSDWGKRITDYEVCTTLCGSLDSNDLLGSQKIGGLWRIYVKSADAQAKLLTAHITYNSRTVPVYKENPFRTGADSPDEKTTRIVVKDLPLSVQNTCLEQYMLKEGVTTARKIDYGKARDPVTHQLSNWYNGDRIIFAKEMKQPLPRFAQIGSFTCRIFHDGQEVSPNKLCTNCFDKDHTRGSCTKPKVCPCCKKPGHSAGDEDCEVSLAKPNTGITPVHGETNPLSNMYPCTLKALGKDFNSVEQAYQYSKAIRRGQLDVATSICSAPTPMMAKKQAKFLKYDKNWTKKEKSSLMSQLLEAKYAQVQEFKDALQQTGKNTIVETVPGEYTWGSGITEKATLNTKKKSWPGENLMGRLLEDLRTSLPQRRK